MNSHCLLNSSNLIFFTFYAQVFNVTGTSTRRTHSRSSTFRTSFVCPRLRAPKGPPVQLVCSTHMIYMVIFGFSLTDIICILPFLYVIRTRGRPYACSHCRLRLRSAAQSSLCALFRWRFVYHVDGRLGHRRLYAPEQAR